MNWFGTNVQGVKPYQGITNAWQWLKDQWSDITGVTANQQSVADTNATNLQIAQDTNAQNYDVAMQNLGFQKDLQEYNKALQQQIFEREDTAYQRTAQDMRAAGLNPLSMQGTNGAGEVIAMSPMENQYQAQQALPMQAFQRPNMMNEFINAVSSVVSNINDLKTGKLTRDKLRTETQKTKFETILDNMSKGVFVNENGSFDFDEEQFNKYLEHEKAKYQEDIEQWEENHRNREHDKKTDRYTSDSKESRMITDLVEWLTGDRGKEAWEKLKKQYPLLNLFDEWAKVLDPSQQPKIEVTRPFAKPQLNK